MTDQTAPSARPTLTATQGHFRLWRMIRRYWTSGAAARRNAPCSGYEQGASPADLTAASDAATVQRWMTLDLWTAFGGDPADFDGYYDALGFGAAWASLCAEARRKRDRPLPDWCVANNGGQDG